MLRRFNSSSSTTGNANSFNMETELETNLNASLIVWSLNTNESETSSTSAGGLYLAGGILKPALLKNDRNELIVAFSIKFLLDLLGGLTNAALLIVCLHQRHGGSSGIKWLIIQYSAAYFTISFIFYPIRDAMILGSFFNLRVPGQKQCAHIATANTVVLALANWTDVCLAVNRLVAICFPHHYDLMKKGSTVVLFLTLTWLISITTIVGGTYGWPRPANATAALSVCSNIRGGAGPFLSAFESFISYTVVGVCVLVIVVKAAVMAHQRRRVTDLSAADTQQMRTHKRRMKVAVMLIASFVWNCASNFPFMILTLGFPAVVSRSPTLTLWSRVIRGVQYTVSPMVFFLFSAEYRSIGMTLLRRLAGAGRGHEHASHGGFVTGVGNSSDMRTRKEEHS